MPAECGRNRRPTTIPPLPTDYGHLEQLFEIQTLLAQSTGIEQACHELLSIVTKGMRVRTVVLLHTTQELDRTLSWAAQGIGPAELEQACTQS